MKIEEALATTEELFAGNTPHRPSEPTPQYRAGAQAFVFECAGCAYWTGYGKKLAVCKQIITHSRQGADGPPVSELETAVARLESLRRERRRIGGRGAARKKAWADIRIQEAEDTVKYWEAKRG